MFLSKKERAELALKKRQEEVEGQKKKLSEEKESRSKYLRVGSHRPATVCLRMLGTCTYLISECRVEKNA